MPTVVRLRIRPEAPADLDERGRPWRVSVDDLRTRPVEEHLSSEEVLRIRAAVGKAMRPAPGRKGPDPAVGQALARLTASRKSLANQLPFLLGPVTGRPGRPVLAVDAEGEAASWPWELLASSPETAPLEHTRRASVARVSKGPGQPEVPDPAHKLRVVYWCPVPSDAQNARRTERLEALLRDLAAEDALEFGSAVDAPPTPDRPVSTVLHVIAGENTDVIGTIVGDARGGAAAQVAASWLRGVDLVYLDIASNGGVPPDVGLEWARQAVAAGAPACVAPFGSMDSDTSVAVTRALYRGLVGQESLTDAVAAARNEVLRRGAGAWPALWVGDPTVLERASLVERRWRPEGWPTPAPDAARLMHRAYLLANQAGSGFVGLEHFALALQEEEEISPLAARIRDLLAPRAHTVRQRLASLVPQQDREPDWRGTPRLRAYGPLLSPGFDLDDLWDLIASDGAHGLHEVAGRSLTEAREGTSVPSLRPVAWSLPPDVESLGPAGLQIAGGPEDGQILKPRDGDVLGRASDSTRVAFPLYADTLLVDRRLSRRHVKWLGDGRILAARRVRVRRAGSEVVYPPGEVALQIGDLVRLSRGTRLRVLGAGEV